MNFYGLERPIEYTGAQIFDPTMAKMVLDAQDKYFNVVYADYQRGLQEMKDFKKEYGDFLTPILADQDWYNKNVTGKVRDFIDGAYARGIDLTRSAEGRAAISQLINSIDVGSIAKLRSSAENAREFLKERAKLEAAGLYNPLLAKYDGPDVRTYSTLDRLDAEGNIVHGSGIWDKMSPTRITDVATFGNPYFEGMKPNIHSESKNGVSYSVESITEDDLKNVANAHFNELVSTPQGQLMYAYYQDLAKTTGGNARDMFNQAIVDGQRRRIYQKDDYDDQWAKREQLKQGWARINQAQKEFEWKKATDLLALGLDENGNPIGGSKLMPKGAADQIAQVQNSQYMNRMSEIKQEYESDKKKEQEYYKKLSPGYKIIADKYKKAKDVVNNPSSKREDVVKAANFIAKWGNKQNKEFADWNKAYEKATTGENATYYKNISTANKPGEEQQQLTTVKNAHKIFQDVNIVGDVSTRQKAALNTVLNIVEQDGKKIGTVGKDTEFTPITEAKFTGSRMYRYNSLISKINRLIKGKQFNLEDEEDSSRKYGSASRKNTRYDIIQSVGEFVDSDIINLLDGFDNAYLGELGISKTQNGYKIPISTSFSKGGQAWADVNTKTHELNKSVSEEAAIEQARALVNKYGNGK